VELAGMSIRALLADDSEIVRKGIRQLLETIPDFELVGEASDFAHTIQMTNELNPRVIIMDLHLPDESNFTLMDIKSCLSHSSFLLAISMWDDEATKSLAEISPTSLISRMQQFDLKSSKTVRTGGLFCVV
jgi:DNA-binding NarL/FixJ family response regulator